MNERRLDGIIVDAGHGGIDSGAVGNNMQEKDLTLEASLYMAERLQELGIPVILTREGDTYLPKSERVRKILSITNQYPNTILVSNHINAGGAEGAEVVYSLKNNPTLANLVLKNIGEKGQLMRKVYQRRLPENPNKDYYYILRETGNTEPILIEYGFIDNQKDANKLRNNLKDYVEGVVKALAEYTGYPYSPPREEEAMDYYVVQRGDTLYSISRKVNIPVEEIKRINQLTSNLLSVGQKLYLIEEDPKEATIYIVGKGDTLYSIASRFQTTVEEIKRLNQLTSNTLSIGQELLIKEGNFEISEELFPTEDYDIYTIQKGDSLWGIAQKYQISVPELIALNNLSSLTLQIGEQLLVPKKEELSEEYYIVQKGDTLWSVAKKNEIDVNTLKELNGLESNLLSIGQVLKVK